MYEFNHELNANATLKERFVWVIYLGYLFFLLYGCSNQLAEITAPHLSLVFEWEKNIPFIDIFIFPYMSSDIIFVISIMLLQTRFQLRVLTTRITFVILFSVFIFILFPLEYSFSKPVEIKFEWLFNILKADLSYNQMPSLHISLAIILFDSLRRNIKNNFINFLILTWMFLICLSTLFVYQHHFIDIPTGIIVALITMMIFPHGKKTNITKRFTTPRSLKIGIYYLILATGFIFISFYLSNIYSIIFAYISVSMLFMSLIYAFGIVEVFEQKRYYFFLLPYFLGNYLSWIFFKNKLPLYNQLNDYIYFGRMPTKKEYNSLKNKNIDIFINLANDLKFINYYNADKNINFLDMTIQNPTELEKIYQFIKRNKNKKVFIHCKFGLSRTIIFILYYLYKENNFSCSEIFSQIKNIDHIYILKKYMKVNYQIFYNENLITKGKK
ncbi:phosphatase PAP2/dual specificity phosphatase family protein [Arcobacter sp. CECT 8985]|uniref:phosphatase PAP2/dual specificity phosphatase family protein n=1 Tax=Arcobacter sp. CECT 8985 TaxID=1935424 RepID=UPI00100B36D6|nr:phosphatase PAP2/dual specificity phosphatase family protein [Arcobacter sp. CECT 8985]RXJ83416.1 hypothetical protein CRU93_13840 [Arcobacter sp. CECT 8985]